MLSRREAVTLLCLYTKVHYQSSDFTMPLSKCMLSQQWLYYMLYLKLHYQSSDFTEPLSKCTLSKHGQQNFCMLKKPFTFTEIFLVAMSYFTEYCNRICNLIRNSSKTLLTWQDKPRWNRMVSSAYKRGTEKPISSSHSWTDNSNTSMLEVRACWPTRSARRRLKKCTARDRRDQDTEYVCF